MGYPGQTVGGSVTLAVTSAEALRKQSRWITVPTGSNDRKRDRQRQSRATGRRANTSDSTEFDIDDSGDAERD